ncbi:hybrid sensor histidine kinase/response regulator [Pyxidicoccus xibeiensis]|uniref:hybrid sensor histidine kinase/response regulator n=1 Tax=Pyxidicoccus xibeiensis TaxID=2906759 RepID=UPI0020A7C01F|nr:ATP-binding protein [Pyxidicoccus xibeiensis]MCP3135939.1 ATP-binding protein [Pyxidicoccus xibeiensis]
MSEFAEMSKAELIRALEQLEPVLAARDELQRVVQDLRRHQIEVEMQNRALRDAQQALEQSHHRYVDLYDFAPVAYVSLDSRACIQEMNLTAAALLRRERSALLGQPFLPFVEPQDASPFLQHVRRCLVEGGEGTLELRLRIAGARVDARLHSRPFQGSGPGDARVCRMALLDVTQLRETQARLELSERLASLGTLAAGVGHELNNPLAFVIQALELMRLRLEDPLDTEAEGELRELLMDAVTGAERIRSIVKDLNAFSRVEEERQARLDVREVLDLSSRMAQAEFRHRARLVRDYAEVPPVLASEGRLGQVFLNLLVNAARAIPEGAADRNEIRLVTRSEEGMVVVEVHDTGGGIPPERLGRIFDPFFTTGPKGLGLGLSISHSLVTRMGGELSVESETGRGSRFRVRLPAAHPASAPRPAAAASKSVPAPARVRRARILIVDDEPMFLSTLAMMLEDDHDVEECGYPRVAVDRIRNGPPLDVIICDLMMPELTGQQLYEAVEAEAPDMARRIIFMTGGVFTMETRSFLERVKNPRLLKPFKPEELEVLLQGLLA